MNIKTSIKNRPIKTGGTHVASKKSNIIFTDRRRFLTGAASVTAAGFASHLPMPALAQGAPLKVGLMLPYSGTFAKLGKFVDDGFRLYVEQQGGKLGGRPVTFVQVDDESKPEAATDNMNRLVGREKVDVVVGTVHSGVAMAMVKVARDTNSMLIIPNAGANEATGPMCAPHVFRTSFSNWQPCFPMGKVMYDAGHRNVATITWRYAAGTQMVDAFKEGFTKAGGKIAEELAVPFPEVEFQALVTRIATLKPDAVFAFFAGGGAVKFVKDYAAAGLNKSIPLYGAGFLTDGTIPAQGTLPTVSRRHCTTPTISTIWPTKDFSQPSRPRPVTMAISMRCRVSMALPCSMPASRRSRAMLAHVRR